MSSLVLKIKDEKSARNNGTRKLIFSFGQKRPWILIQHPESESASNKTLDPDPN